MFLYHVLFIHSYINEHLGYFCLFNNIAVIVGAQILVRIPTSNSPGYIPVVELLDHMVNYSV